MPNFHFAASKRRPSLDIYKQVLAAFSLSASLYLLVLASGTAKASGGNEAVFPGQSAGLLNSGFEEAGRGKRAANWESWPQEIEQGYLRDNDAGMEGSAALVIANPQLASGCGAHQRLELNQDTAQPLFFSLYSRELKAPRGRGKQALTYGAQFRITYVDGSESTQSAFFGKQGDAQDLDGKPGGWLHLSGYIWPAYVKNEPGRAKAIKTVDLYLVYNGAKGSVAFDELELLELRPDLDSIRPLDSPTRLLSYSTMNPAYAADHANEWALTGLDGFMFDHGQLLFGDNPASAADLEAFKDCIRRLKQAGIGENFLIIQNRRGNGPDFSDVFDDAAWNSLIKSFGSMARYARECGLRGLVLDMEPVISKKQPRTMLGFYAQSVHDEAATANRVFERGKQLMQKLEEEYPDLTVILLPHLARHDSPNYRFYGDWFAGMAAGSRNAADNLIIGEERSQTSYKLAGFNLSRIVQDEANAARAALDAHSETHGIDWDHRRNLALNPAPTAFWRRVESKSVQAHWAGRPEIFGDQDLGSAYADKSAKYRADHFYAQLQAMHEALPEARYCWLYDHGASMWQMTPEELERYGPNGNEPVASLKWAYRARTGFSKQPTDPFLGFYFAAMRRFFGSDN